MLDSIPYDYIVHNISEDGEPAYKAVIPAFSAIVYGGSLVEIENGVRFSIESEIAERKKNKQSIPSPDRQVRFSGKLLIRIAPNIHERLALEAKSKGKSLNKYIAEKLTV